MSTEIFSIIEDITSSTSIQKSIILKIIQDSFIKRISKFYEGYDIVCDINKATGKVDFFYKLDVVDKANFTSDKIHILEKDLTAEEKESGEKSVLRKIESSILKNHSRELIKKDILEMIDLEKKNIQYESLMGLLGTVINCVVMKVEESHVLMNIKNIGEAIMFKNAMLPGDAFEVGDKVLCCLYKVERNTNGCPAILSRRAPAFFEGLLKRIVPEAREGLIEIAAIAGHNKLCTELKIAVRAVDQRVNPVTVCIGRGASNLAKFKEETKIRKIDFVYYDPDRVKFVVNAFRPVNVLNVQVSETDENRIEVVVPDSELKFAIGAGGHNAKLISDLVKANIEIKGSSQKAEEQKLHFAALIENLIQSLKVDDVIAQLLVSNGFEDPRKIAQEDVYRISLKIPGFGSEIAEELIARAKEFIENQEIELKQKLEALEVRSELYEIFGISLENCVSLGENGIKTIEDISKLSAYQLMKICKGLTKLDCENLIKNSISYLSYEGE